MPTGTIILLGAFAGLTIYLGLPLAFLRNAPQSFKTFASMLATGVLIFLLYDVIGKASEPINEVIDQIHKEHTGGTTLIVDVALLVLGLGIGLLGLVYFNKFVIKRVKAGKRATSPVVIQEQTTAPAAELALAGVRAREVVKAEKVHAPAAGGNIVATASSGEVSPYTLALIIAVGIGLHNFSEGLAIGASAVQGALQVATVLIVGFGLHNMTEGFGIAGPLSGLKVSWKFILLAGLIGGGPTFLGTIVGISFYSPQVFIFFLALAAGAIIYVVAELLGVARRVKAQDLVMWGLLAGFLLGYATDLIVTYAGA